MIMPRSYEEDTLSAMRIEEDCVLARGKDCVLARKKIVC